ncbi:MAG TPA: hypothetical protein VM452_16855 [Caulifigura sp.]|nr:hypothetical protein [Caulifigura sp.]
MAQILVRGIEDDVWEKLREIAREIGQSVEETARDILRDAVRQNRKSVAGWATKINNRFKDCGLKPGEITEWKRQRLSVPAFE